MKNIEDPRIPGLQTALDPDAVTQLLVDNFPEFRQGFQVLEARIIDVQYKPGMQCLVLYRLKFHVPDAYRSRRQEIIIDALPEGEAPLDIPEELLARYRTSQNRNLPTPCAYDRKAHIAIHAFPLDPVLTQLSDIMDGEIMKRRFHDLWRDRRIRVRRVIPTVLAYTPRSRATILYEILSESKDSDLPEIRYVIGKVHKLRPAWRLFAGAWSLWQASKMRVRLAPPGGYIGDLNMTLQERCPGVRLGDLAGDPSYTSAVRETGRSIAIVHGLCVPTVSKRTPQREIQSVERWGSVVAALFGERSGEIEQLRNDLASQLEAKTEMKGLVHGDFHPANVLVDDTRITLIDLDQMALGDPLVDVGRFLASQRIAALRVHGDIGGLSCDADHFLERYLANSGEDESRVRLFEAAALMTSAATGFRLQRPGWEDSASMIIDEARRVFALSESRKSIHVATGSAKGDRDSSSEVQWDEDKQYMKAVLDPCIRDTYGAELTSCMVQVKSDTPEHKHIRYSLRGTREGQKWGVKLDGLVWHQKSGRNAHKRLIFLRDALEDMPDAPLLPRPVAYLSELRLQVLEVPGGMSLKSLLGTSAGVDAAEQIAGALRKLRNITVDRESTRGIEREIERVEQRLARLQACDPALYTRAMAIWEGVKQRV
ncbi:MAG: phosphotransferase, partial [Thiohalobacterales bacterium]|nr:phosphotransferase [Thiohalobacterales bacterium]